MFKDLFDFKFETLITRKILGVVYAIVVVALTLTSIFILGSSLFQVLSGPILTISVLLLFATPIAWFFSVVILRVAIESSIALIIVAENTKK